MKITCILSFILLTSCHITIKDENVCPEYLRPIIKIKNYLSTKDDYATLSKIDNNQNIIDTFEPSPNYIRNYDHEHTYIDFHVKNNQMKPQNYYRLTHNSDTYFIYNINLAESSHYSMCDRETTYKINDCEASGFNIIIDQSCAIPLDQANEYFETHIKPNLD